MTRLILTIDFVTDMTDLCHINPVSGEFTSRSIEYDLMLFFKYQIKLNCSASFNYSLIDFNFL